MQVELVKYQCTCGIYHPLDRLYFCRHCVASRCGVCNHSATDITYCRQCFESITMADARSNKNRCGQCYQCPICACSLQPRTVQDRYRLQCSNCKYTSLDAGYEDSTNSAVWPELPSGHDFNAVRSKMTEFAKFEKEDFERRKPLRRKAPIMSFVTDKFGIGNILRAKQVAAPDPLIADDFAYEPEELTDDDIFATVESNKVLTEEQCLRSMHSTNEQVLPNKLPLSNRQILRCGESQHTLYRSEYSPTSIGFRIKFPAYTSIPEILINQKPQLTAGQSWPVCFMLSNNGGSPYQVSLSQQQVDDEEYVNFEPKEINVTIPIANQAGDIEEQISAAVPTDGNNAIVFRKRHRVGICTNVTAKKIQKHNYLLLVLSNTFEVIQPRSSSQTNSKGEHTTRMLVRVDLGESAAAVEE